jgi:superfamily II DNA or RNA helicase
MSSSVVLKPHQEHVISFALKHVEEYHRFLLFHSVGSGKTITSILMAYSLFRSLNLDTKIIIAAPVSILPNFTKEIAFLKLDPSIFDLNTYYRFLSKLKKESDYATNCIVIIDEIHNFRSANVSSTTLIKGIRNAKKVIMLSATPIINNIFDFSPILAILNNVKYSKAADNLYNAEYLENKISVYKISDTELTMNYPKTKTKYIDLYMDRTYYTKYLHVEREEANKLPPHFKNKDFTVFLNGLRRASNNLFTHSPKIDWIINHVNGKTKTIVYSFWKNSGIYLIRDLLRKKKVSVGLIEGSVSAKDRTKIINDYNTNKLSVLLISSAGSEGLDLKETRQVIILEPHWNNEKLKQVIGRAVRYNSHKDLSESKKNVIVYYLILKKPKKSIFNIFRRNERKSIDEFMMKLSNDKEALNKDYIKYIKKYSI